MQNTKKRLVRGIALLCAAAYVVSALTGGQSNRMLFSVYRFRPTDVLGYVRLVGHVLGHGSVEHLVSNMMFVLILGPMLEEKYGGANLAFVILATALVTGLVNVIFFPRVALLGASGVVFAMILLSSFAGRTDDAIPLTLILVAALYLGMEIYDMIAVQDNVSQLAHVIGGLVGAGLGFALTGRKRAG